MVWSVTTAPDLVHDGFPQFDLSNSCQKRRIDPSSPPRPRAHRPLALFSASFFLGPALIQPRTGLGVKLNLSGGRWYVLSSNLDPPPSDPKPSASLLDTRHRPLVPHYPTRYLMAHSFAHRPRPSSSPAVISPSTRPTVMFDPTCLSPAVHPPPLRARTIQRKQTP